MMRINHLAFSNAGGGAAIAASRLHLGLLRIGASSRMHVANRIGDDPTVTTVPRAQSCAECVQRCRDQARFAREQRPYAKTVSPWLELFSNDRVAGRDLLAETLPHADVYNLHWVAGFLDYRRFFRCLASGTPLVWTLHDMNPFTGGCHYSLGCERFSERCGPCPQLGSANPDDLSARIYRRKRRAIASLDAATTRIVATSRWLQAEAQRSSLLGRFTVELIPYGLDTEVFTPRRKEIAREVFGVPQGKPMVLFVADNVSNHRKGFDLLQAALRDLDLGRHIILAAIGKHAPTVVTGGTVALLGRIDNERMMSFAYSAADVFVMPSRAEAFGQVVFEAMACGTPVVAFDVGGVPDMVRPGKTGLLAPPEDVRALREAIVTILTDDDLRFRLSAQCRRVAVTEYALDVQARRYIEVYETLVEAADRARTPAHAPIPARLT
jgi:glycosyltransferase involved in cell wall biosynthesis